MKKKILFVMNSLICGGAEKSLVTLLRCIDYERYDVDLYLFEQTGLFMELIPSQVHLLPSPYFWNFFNKPFKQSIAFFIKKGRVDLVFCRIAQGKICRRYKNCAEAEQRLWKYIRRGIHPLVQEYDAAIGYLEKNPIYFIVDQVKAKRKIGWIHTDYSKLSQDLDFESQYFSQLQHIITVSIECEEILKNLFPQQAFKIATIENLLIPEFVREMAGKKRNIENHMIKIATAARLAEPKGIDLAIDACKLLVDQGYQIIWKIIGDGPLHEILTEQIKRKNLEGVFILEGEKKNPYHYMKEADIYVQPSRFEGKSIAIEEAKILCKPIVVTAYPTVRQQIEDEVTGLIVDQTAVGISQGIIRIIEDDLLKQKLSLNLTMQDLGNRDEIKKLYRLMEA